MKDLILKHDADHAGGGKEVVYASDGADIPAISFPVKTKHNEIDESEIIPPEQAFQIFANKLYAVNPYSSNNALKDVVSTQSNESPLVRMARLKNELEALEHDCSAQSDFGLFQDQLIKMKGQLNLLSSTQLEKQTGLTSAIESSVSALNDTPFMDAKPSTSVSSFDLNQNASQLEDRVNRLEALFGGNLNTSGGQASLVARVQALEGLLVKLDDKKLDLLQKRSKVIRQDLEAAAKARNKLFSSTTGSLSSDDSKIITSLYDGLQNLNGMSDNLPILSTRLQALAHQHADAATRAARFKAVEQITADLSKQVHSIEISLLSLDKSIKENASLMQENVRALEARTKAF